jgi:hypothetical protein
MPQAANHHKSSVKRLISIHSNSKGKSPKKIKFSLNLVVGSSKRWKQFLFILLHEFGHQFHKLTKALGEKAQGL